MGWEAIIYIGVALLAAGGAYYASTRIKPPDIKDNINPNKIDSFQFTTNSEGTCVPLIFGTVRIAGNLLWFGNLTTVRRESDHVFVGYDYYMDMWQALCIGRKNFNQDGGSIYYADMDILGLYSQDKKVEYEEGEEPWYAFNDGSSAYYPIEVGEYANKLNPVAHIFFKNYFIGQNVSSVPTLHYVIRSKLGVNTIDSSANTMLVLCYNDMASGANPAGVILYLLELAGAISKTDTDNEINYASFNDAAEYWIQKNYGLNIVLSQQENIEDILSRIFVHVDGTLYKDSNGQYTLKAFKETDRPVCEIDTEKFKKFVFRRRSWSDVYSDFRASYIDINKDFVERSVGVRNPAVSLLIGKNKQLKVDLTYFNSPSIAMRRLWEIMKKESYPEATIECELPSSYSNLEVGSVVYITNSDYGISQAKFRIMEKTVENVESNSVNLLLTQMLDDYFDIEYISGDDSLWQEENNLPVPAISQRVFEIPFAPDGFTNSNPKFLLLVARSGSETSYDVYISQVSDGYEYKAERSVFSQKGVLDSDYPITTSIDDEIGITFSIFYREDPIFSTITRDKLFSAKRVVIIDNEIMSFQNVTYVGDNSIRLTGVIRGKYNTAIENHVAGSDVWLSTINENSVINVPDLSNFNVKIVPRIGNFVANIASCEAINVTSNNLVQTPYPVAQIKAVRSGSSISITIHTTTKFINGAGMLAPEMLSDSYPFQLDGDLEWYTSISTTPQYTYDSTISYTQSGEHTFYIKQRYNGYSSSISELIIGASDGTYIGPNILSSGLETIKYGAHGWTEIMDRNARLLNDTLLKASNLLDVDINSLSNNDVLYWNTSKWSNKQIVNVTTTTTIDDSLVVVTGDQADSGADWDFGAIIRS